MYCSWMSVTCGMVAKDISSCICCNSFSSFWISAFCPAFSSFNRRMMVFCLSNVSLYLSMDSSTNSGTYPNGLPIKKYPFGL